jgi:carboxyl-terminal processing protease
VLQEALLDGLLETVSGDCQRLSAKEHKVQEQVQGNRYVGIHIQVRYDPNEKRTIIDALVPGGPADRAGMKKGDRFEQIDGVDTTGMDLRQVVDRLRGEDGTDVLVKVRQPGASEARTLKATRGPLFIPTVAGIRKKTTGEWDFRASGSDPIGYLRIRDISSSTPHELRKAAHILSQEGLRALILDLRGLSATDLHAAVLLADSLLERGRIGQVRTTQGVMTYDATPDALFQGWPLVALVDAGTAAGAEWLAAALQDNHRAILVGNLTASGRPPKAEPGRTSGTSEILSTVPIGESGQFLRLVTGRLERGDGRPLTAPPARRSPPAPSSPRTPDDSEQGARGGVRPDHFTPVRKAGPGVGRQSHSSSMFGHEGEPTDPWSDGSLTKGIEVLGGALLSL